MSDSVRPHRWQPTRLPRPWDSPGKNTGVGCHFLLQCMKVKSESGLAQSCLTLCNPMDCSLPGSSVHGIFPGKSTGVGAIDFSAWLISPQKVGKWVLRGETQGRTLGWEPEGRESIGGCGGLLTMRSLEWVVIGSPKYQ